MSKFLYALSFLVASSILLCSAYAMKPESVWHLDEKYEGGGRVFPSRCIYKKETDQNDHNHIRHSPVNSEELSAATVELVSPGAILHDNYYEISSPRNAIKSFKVTPNPTGLTKESADLASLPTTIYGYIYVRIDSKSESIDLLIFPNRGILVREDYPQTMTAASRSILFEYIPSIQGGKLFNLRDTILLDDITELPLQMQQRSDANFIRQGRIPAQ